MTIEFSGLAVWLLLLAAAVNAFIPKWTYYDWYWYVGDYEKTDIDPERYTSPFPSRVQGTRAEVPSPLETPDYRMEEKPYYRYYHYSTFEEDRPYRLSPFYKQHLRLNQYESPEMTGCTCTTVYKRLRMLATCAVLTRRHVLTTATSTELVLRKRRHFLHLENILGVWYDIADDRYNSSMYVTPARIHYHPRYVFPKDVNRSHPFPMMHDLSVWTTTHRMYGGSWLFGKGAAYCCARGSSYWWETGPPTPGPNELAYLVGYQFIKAFHRNPLPWVKYGVRTRKHYQPCPKTEWGWFHCVSTTWAPLGLDQGMNMHRTFQGGSWLYDGLIGINSLSMKLRTIDMVHYFTVLDTHSVLDFLYDSYMGLLKWEFLDYRFHDTKHYTLECKNPESLYWNWEYGEEKLYGMDLPNY
ncbi:unnamed protein product [Chilo suppressalis]|uniref:Uncharacterized protein n=1 Tax=Chilo suppressalis TaxID=168631 RepID=A0ABN8B1B8_CHISP|nr:hypothetical protein evm_011488 [Chilo suppressalis]CAH0401535.1 unnamed protein product [Chilo suppressalis]